MDVASRETLPNYAWSQRARHARDCVLNEFWQIFVDDRLVHRDAINTHANVQSKAVFSNALTVMDKIYCWEEEEKLVGSNIEACMWIYTKVVLCDGQESTQEYLKRWMSSIMESVNWVCEEACEGQEWVSDLTISIQEEEVLVDLDYELDVPCVVQWGLLWLSAPRGSIKTLTPTVQTSRCTTRLQTWQLWPPSVLIFCGSTRQRRAC